MEFSKTRKEIWAIASLQNAMFAFNVSKLRERLGISQKEMAKKLSVSVKLYDEFEHCESTLSIIQAYEISYILGVYLGDI